MAKGRRRKPTNTIAIAIGAAIGVLVSIQGRANAALARDVGDAIGGAALGFILGWVIITVLLFTNAQHRAGLRAIPSLLRAGQLRWWLLLGGLGGATLVASQGFAVPVLGVSLFTVALVAGQTTSSLEVDRLGLGPSGRLHPSRSRVVASVISVVAVVVAINPFSNAISFQPVAVFVCLFAGTLVSAQQAFNGRVAMATGSPIAAAWMNFSVGGVMLWSLTFIRQVDFSGAPSPIEKPYLYVGGLIGAIFVAVAARLVRTLGVLLLTLTSIAGQLLGAVILDIFIPTPGRVFNGWVALGVALTFVAVIVGSGRLDGVRSRHQSV